MDKKIIEHFKKVDSTLYAVIKRIGQLEVWKFASPDDYFKALCGEIINQQLSEKAADTIYSRFENLFTTEKITPLNVLNTPDEKLRQAGMSWSKVQFIKSLAQKVFDKQLQLEKLRDLEDELVLKEITKVKGIGPWTAEMFLMFTLGREDIFSYGDLGLRKAIKKLYKFRHEPSKKQIEKIVSKWRPYRTYACRILWKSLKDQGRGKERLSR